jgi:hypothetical protein
MLRGRFAPRAQAAGLGSVPDSGARTASHLTQIAHPVPVESWAGIVFADAPDPIREMS